MQCLPCLYSQQRGRPYTYEGTHDEGEDGDTNNRGCHVDKPVRKEGGDAEEDDVVEEIIPVLVNLTIPCDYSIREVAYNNLPTKYREEQEAVSGPQGTA